MAKLENKINFAVLVQVCNANANGDPLNGNRPRTDREGYGEITDVCIKRKIRNRFQDMGKPIFVQSKNRRSDDCKSLSERASKNITNFTDPDDYAKKACEKWIDVRAFGQVFGFKGRDEKEPVSVGVCGPVSIQLAKSCSPVEIKSIQITKSVNNEPGDKNGSDTMGMKHMVEFGLYVIKGSINCYEAEKTGFSKEDAEDLKIALRTLFINDASAARPEGSMEVVKVFWWEHNNKNGQYRASKVFNTLKITPKDGVEIPASEDDYDITLNNLPGLEPEVIEGL